MPTFSRPPPARAIEARGRGRALGVRVEGVDRGRRYRTRSRSAPASVGADAFPAACYHEGPATKQTDPPRVNHRAGILGVPGLGRSRPLGAEIEDPTDP